MDFTELFSRAMGGHRPYPYQEKLATEGDLPGVLSVPTGLGKTAAVVLGWLWRRRFAAPDVRQATPRRLVYCLPMRTLVRQTAEVAERIVEALAEPLADTGGPVGVCRLMGGEVDTRWDLSPEADLVVVGTQDMLLSRALNRGFAASRFRWPIQFGLLNNHCLWVMDEVQLMDNGLSTTAQLQAFRERMGALGPTRSLWMSATLPPEALHAPDLGSEQDPARSAGSRLELSEADRADPQVDRRIRAPKALHRVDPESSPAQAVLQAHRAGTRTLVVMNTVKRAQELFKKIRSEKPSAECVLLHSRFRPPDRKRALGALLREPGPEGSITVTTQVVEAGVDVSAATLFTELAPWASLVQRMGRCNRAGERDDARVFWIDLDTGKPGPCAPYEREALDDARQQLEARVDAAPDSLPPVTDTRRPTVVLRRRDLLELFDTTPDLAGAHIDVSRFIRDTDDHDVRVFWRDLEGEEPQGQPEPLAEELCTVPVAGLARFEPWGWDALEGRWVRVTEPRPGMVLLLDRAQGGYSCELGWTGQKTHKPTVFPLPDAPVPEANDDDHAVHRRWQTLAEHTDGVVEALESLLAQSPELTGRQVQALRRAARWHDAGKAHPVFQQALSGDPPVRDSGELWAKSARRGARYARRGFRHELASALAVLSLEPEGGPDTDLVAWLVAAHHGRIRLSIRSLPHERPDPEHPEQRFARGLRQGDVLRAGSLGGGESLPPVELDLSVMDLGEGPAGPSWMARAIALRDDPSLGPFRLALLEALLRIADWRASAEEV